MRVGTHSGRFHADEVMATALLKQLYDIEVVRSRDPDILDMQDLIYDVGEGEFDHHQPEKRYREGRGSRGNDASGTPYAACGLIWDHFGRDIIRRYEPAVTEDDLDYLFREIDAMLIEGIDAADNGLKTCRTFIPTLNISAIISKFNPPWDSGQDEDSAFHEAVGFASAVFINLLNQKFSVVRAREYVQKAYDNRDDRELLILDDSYPWNDLLYDIDRDRELLYVIYPDHGQYMLQMARRFNGKYGDVKPLPRSWAGKREEELSAIVGIADAVFCHADRFIAGAKSMESVLKMAKLALAEPDEPEEEKKRRFLEALKGFLLSGRIRISR